MCSNKRRNHDVHDLFIGFKSVLMMIRVLLRIGRQTVRLPISAKLPDENVGSVIEAVLSVLGKAGR